MRDQLWPSDTFVDFEHGINASLRKLRQALGDSAGKPLYIETLPGIGYRFIAPFEVVEEPAVHLDDIAAEPPSFEPRVEEAVDPDSEIVAGPTWRRRIPFALAAGFVVLVVLFLFTAQWNRRIVHGASATPQDAQAAFNSSPQPHASTQESATAASESDSSSPHSSSPSSPALLFPIRGKVWVVSVARASNVTFPAPTDVPDATFVTRGIAYIGSQPKHCYTIVSFLTECSIGGYELKFSGLPNPNLGGKAAGPDTAMSGDTWGILIEFIGTTTFTRDQDLSILHDDGVALQIDGQSIPGFYPQVTPPVMESARFTGPTGLHSFDLLYANAAGSGAWLLFYPALY
jgi:hypothetical protein